MTTVKPVLVTGAPRSGTTWVGNMLAASPQLYYIHEPFNPDYRPGGGICSVRFTHHQTYISEKNEHVYYEPLRRMLAGEYNYITGLRDCRSFAGLKKEVGRIAAFRRNRRQQRKPLIKDPIALMSAGWLGRRFDLNVVVMIRHPAAFAASMKRLNWGFNPSRWVFNQPLLLQDYLADFELELRELVENNATIIEQAALFWKVAYSVVTLYQKQYPHWVFLKHEELARNPLGGYRELFARLNLEFTETVREKIAEYSNESNPEHSSGQDKLLKLNSRKVIYQWKKVLSDDEISRIRQVAGSVAEQYYSDKDWE